MFKVYCCRCHKLIYLYHGTFEGPIQRHDFHPAFPHIAVPTARDPMLCPLCKEPWYMTKTNGALVVITDKGWKPRNPDGRAPHRSRIHVSWPSYLTGKASEHQDPSGG